MKSRVLNHLMKTIAGLCYRFLLKENC